MDWDSFVGGDDDMCADVTRQTLRIDKSPVLQRRIIILHQINSLNLMLAKLYVRSFLGVVYFSGH